MSRLTIRTRLVLLSGALLAVLVATNFYLTQKLAVNSGRTVVAAELLKAIEEANYAQIAFGDMRYWMTDLAVSQLTLAERNAAAARQRMDQHLDKLTPWNPERIKTVRGEIAQYEELATKAVDEYANDHRVIGNSLLAQARMHSLAADQLLTSIVTELTGEAIAAPFPSAKYRVATGPMRGSTWTLRAMTMAGAACRPAATARVARDRHDQRLAREAAATS